jgi:NAD(P)-dependent dehydrogenase (short-subunit alcohol dehydrogenase family)
MAPAPCIPPTWQSLVMFHAMSKLFNGKLLSVVDNVTKEETVTSAIEKIVEEAGALHGMVANAGRRNRKAALDFTEEEIQNLFAVNPSVRD